jgi:threonyl-tRNA synthetase
VRVELDDRDETLSKRIRDAELEKVPLIAVWGEKETDSTIAVRRRGAGQETMSLEALIDEVGSATPA